MTTATEADIDLNALFALAPMCQLLRHKESGWEPCGREAVWRIIPKRPECGHDTVDFVLACDPCLQGILRGDNPLRCSWDGMTSGCLLHVYIDRVEQL